MNIHDNGSKPVIEIDPSAILNKRRRGVRVTYAAAVALGLAVGGGAVAGAATGSSSTSTTTPADHAEGLDGHQGWGGTTPAAFGTVASVGTNTFTLTKLDGTNVTVDVGSSTTYLDPGVTTPTIADVKVGDHVAVFGTDTNNTVAGTKVAIGGPGGPGGHLGSGGTPPAAFGIVASVGTNTFTLTTLDGASVTVDVSGTTTYLDPGVTTPTIADVKVGDHVAVFGTGTNNTVAATKVAIGGPGGPGGHQGWGGTNPAAFGTVASVGTNTFTVTSPDGTNVTVGVGSSTSYMEFGKTSASVADVTVGARVVVFGTHANNTVTATKVGIGSPPTGAEGPAGPRGAFGPGGMGGWAPAPSGSTSSRDSSSANATTSSGSSSGGTLA